MDMSEDIMRLNSLADAAAAQGDMDAAMGFLLRICQNHPQDIAAAIRYLEVLLNTEALHIADEFAKQARVSYPPDEQLLALCDRAFAAVSAYHRVTAQKADADGDFDLAYEHWSALVEREPDHPWAAAYQVESLGFSRQFPEKLQSMDLGKPRTRIYLTGCGRSGTWMLASMMQCFDDTIVGQEEVHFGAFAYLNEPHRVHVLKRMHNSHQYLDRIPAEIGLIYIVRNPFDVLTSKHLGKEFFVTPEAWELEMQGFRKLVETQRENLLVLRYEDLVTKPDLYQKQIADMFELTPQVLFSKFHQHATQTEVIAVSMHGLRAPNGSSIERYRQNPELLAYCKKIKPLLAKSLQWVCNTYEYDQTL